MVRLSYTANTKYQTSPRAYFLHYLLKLREERLGSALAFGSAFDLAINTVLRNKQQKLNDDPIKTFDDAFIYNDYNNEKLDLRTSDKVKWNKSDLDEDIIDNEEDKALMDKGYRAEWVSMRRKGILMIEAYTVQVMPHIKEVISIQNFVSIPNGEGDEIIGYIDFIAKFKVDDSIGNVNPELKKYNDKVIIFDNKTASQAYKADSVKTSDQLGTYFEAPLGIIHAHHAGYIVVPKKFRKQKEPKIPIQIIIDDIEPEVIQTIFDKYQNTLHGIKMGKFDCNPGNCSSSPWGCTYKRYCDSGGKDMTGLVQIKDK